jgi:glycosyltransferase involved in cell wall biosynthesis
MTTISIAMATYNGAQYIAEQLDSLDRQTVLPSELVVTDDGSTDGTLAIVEKFAASAAFPVHCERNTERLGFRGNFMKAASLCRSDIVAFCDQDDIWAPRKLETCLSRFDENTLLVYHNATVVTGKLEPIGLMDREAPPNKINPPQSIDPFLSGSGFTLTFRRSLIAFTDLWAQSVAYDGRNERENHDLWIFYLASSLGTIKYVSRPLALYRKHGTNASGSWKDVSSVQAKLSNLMSTSLDGFKRNECTARNRAFVLEEIKKRLPDKEVELDRAIAGYQTLATYFGLRQDMYKDKNTRSRFQRLMSLRRNGGYRPRAEWGVGRSALIRDIVCCLLFPAKYQGCDVSAEA